jgi:hypothetical protein
MTGFYIIAGLAYGGKVIIFMLKERFEKCCKKRTQKKGDGVGSSYQRNTLICYNSRRKELPWLNIEDYHLMNVKK